MVNEEGKLNIKAPLMSVRREKLICDRHEKQTNLEEDDDDVYCDALETLSPCVSVSGVSGMDNLVANKSTDKEAQELMMNRFLPAAKAMTIQPLQHGPRKKSVLIEQPRDFTKLVRKEKKSTSSVNKHITSQCRQEDMEEESEHESTDDYANISAKGCGLFPQIGNQFSLCCPYEVGKANKCSDYRSAPTITIKKAWDAIHKSKSGSRGEMNHQGRLASFRRSGASVAVRRTRLLGDSKEAENNQFGMSKFASRGHTVLSQGSKRSSNSIEKTLYIDTASTVVKSRSLGDSESRDANSVTLSSMLSLMAKEDEDERLLITDKEMNKKQIVLVDGKCVVPPPLPKSPSESWLCHALPLISLKNSLQGTSKLSAGYSKWETIVKTSKFN